MDKSGSTSSRPLPRALAALACLLVAANTVRAGDAGAATVKPTAEATGAFSAAPVASAEKAAAPDPVKAKMAERLERKLRTEYLKATRGIQVPTLKAEDLLPILEDTNLVLLDIRQSEEQAVSMLPHAMTPREFADRFRKGIPKGKRIVVYCTIGYRSGKYAMELAGQGIRAENLEGGILAWSHAGGPFQVRNDAGLATPTRRVHVYDKGWNFLHPDYEAVW